MREIMEAIPTVYLLILLAFTIIIFAAGCSSKQHSAVTQKDVKMKFAWNSEARTLESDDRNISIRVYGLEYGGSWTKYVLTMNERRIGFATKTPVKKTKDGRRIWVLDGLCIAVQYGRNPTTVYADRTLFLDRKEQERVVGIITAALRQFDGVNQNKKTTDSVVTISDQLTAQLASGDLIQKPHPTSRKN